MDQVSRQEKHPAFAPPGRAEAWVALSPNRDASSALSPPPCFWQADGARPYNPAMTDPGIDPLSPLARRILSVDSATAYTRLVVSGDGNAAARGLLDSATPQSLLATFPANPEDASAILSGLWLWHDWLDASHRISQQNQTPTGSFWHAIMHRREGDFSNSCYWYARCTSHPVLTALTSHAGQILGPLPTDKLLLRIIHNGWNPRAFVDLVERVHDNPEDPRHAAAVSLQQLEWRLLFDHCARMVSQPQSAH